jgi:predicted esterase
MTLKNWFGKSVLACAIINLPALAYAAQPAIALVDPADAPQWQAWAKRVDWQIITPAAAATPDARVQALAAAVRTAVQSGGADPARIYLAGRGPSAAAVFYTISRLPDLWAAAVAIEGSPQPALDTNRIFAANFTNVPVLWLSSAPDAETLAARLKTAGMHMEWRSTQGTTDAVIFDWLTQHQREAFPTGIDCETNAPTFASCYWIQMTKFDPAERNDVLPGTLIPGGSPASLDLGIFSYPLDDPGPGVLVSTLADRYNGPLKKGDRIVAVDGKPLDNGKQYRDMLEAATSERNVVVTVQRGTQRIRVESRLLLPRRDPVVTARVEAQYLPADKEIQIVSRTVTEMRVTIPEQWAQDAKLFWNGLILDKIESPGCILLTIEKELLNAAKCP